MIDDDSPAPVAYGVEERRGRMEPQQAQTKRSPSCPRCGNRLRLLPDQIGTTIMCPKCNATFTVGRPKAADSATDSDDLAYEPEIPLQRSTIVPDADQVTTKDAAEQSQYDADWSSGELEAEAHHVRRPDGEPDYLEIARKKGILRTDDKEDPPPRWTFFSDVFSFPWQGANLARWAGMSFGFAVTGMLIVPIVEAARGGLSVSSMSIPVFSIFATGMGILTLAFSAACCFSTIQDTADGYRDVQDDSLPDWDQWIFTFFGFLNVWIISGALGYPLSVVPEVGPIAIPISAAIFFPILALSAMETDSFLLPFSKSIWSTLRRYWHYWLMFYVLSTSMLAAWFVLTGLAAAEAPFLTVLVSGPALAAVFLIYCRLLGRLAWRASVMPAGSSEEPEAAIRLGAKKRGKRKTKRRRKRIEMPSDLDEAARLTAEDPPAPRVNAPRRP